MNIAHIKEQINDPKLEAYLYQTAYPAQKNGILAIDLEIILSIADANNCHGKKYDFYRMALNK